MALIHDFCQDPDGFLAQYLVIVPMQDEVKTAPAKPRSFEMVKQHSTSTVVELRLRLVMPSNTNSVTAYWLPWHNNMAVTLTLGTEATFMFTTEMTNCRFSVLSGGNEPTRVAHVAGTGSSQNRDTLESKANFTPENSERMLRRMSKSGADLHGYWGQRDEFLEARSAFVFGQFVGNAWVFKAQVAKGNVTGTNITKGLQPQRLEGQGLYTI